MGRFPQLISVSLAVIEQVTFSLASFLVLAFVVFDDRVLHKALELSAFSSLQLPITFLAILFGWNRTGQIASSQVLTLMPVQILSALTAIWAFSVLLLNNANMDIILLVFVLAGSYLLTNTAAIRWLMISRLQFRRLVLANFLSVFVLYFATQGLFSLVELPIFFGFVISRLVFLACLLAMASKDETPKPETSEPHVISVSGVALAIVQYFRHNGIIPIAAMVVPEHALVFGRTIQLFGNLVRMAASPVGNLYYFQSAISLLTLLVGIGMIALGAAGVGAIAGRYIIDPAVSLPWVAISLSTVVSYLAILYCRERKKSVLAFISELISVTVICIMLVFFPTWILVFPAALIIGDISLALAVYMNKLTRG